MAHASQDKHFGPLGSCFAALTPCFEHVVAHKKYLQTKCGKFGEKKSKKKKKRPPQRLSQHLGTQIHTDMYKSC